ncbi:NAD(P)H oxidoreductase [Rhodobacter sp. 24-YEA-8]|uniref:NAD(P)H oxidoreductase n=1 Tax=Rhodobacter sp. 24-YEA-8 TaxID=1884310 RepID=UPI0008993179|nr:NAD(P)H oxidoreductase [Rhodobacter sp. 24-YEA-8]SED75922.1 NAD(P)H dehydrogenase (quinone) [Rhodobacter sp. 24-YEA-8]
MNVLVVFDHPRRNSFCGAVLDRFVDGLQEAGHKAEIADLRAEGFDPRLGVEDEPDRDAPGKIYSPAVLAEQARVTRNDALAFVFPVWWWSLPATSKGWIDRVWNRDWAYGARKLTHNKALLIGLASADAGQYAKRSYDSAMQTQLVQGVLNYCGIEEASLELLHGSTGSESGRSGLLDRAAMLGRTF